MSFTLARPPPPAPNRETITRAHIEAYKVYLLSNKQHLPIFDGSATLKAQKRQSFTRSAQIYFVPSKGSQAGRLCTTEGRVCERFKKHKQTGEKEEIGGTGTNANSH